MLLLNLLPDEYEHLTTTLLHGKDKITLNEVTSTLNNDEIRRLDKKEHRDVSAEVLTVQGNSQSQKSKKKGKSRVKEKLAKDECAFCREKGH